jgi:formamidopyrimidine-DNA glycosylase
MAELPELEIIRTVLARELLGKKIKTVTVTNGKVVRRHKAAREFRVLLEGRTIKSASRLGLNIVFALDNRSHLIITPGPTGELLRGGPKVPKPKHTLVMITTQTGEEIRFIDASGAGEMWVDEPTVEGQEITLSRFARLSVGGDGLSLRRAAPSLALIGIDPLEDQVGWDRLAAVLRSRSVPVKSLLMDQSIVAGLGTLYVDEICFAAGLRFDRLSDSLSVIEIRRLHRSITEIVADALKYSGTSNTEFPFVDPAGETGRYQDHLNVAGRAGETCKECRTPIEKVTFEGHPTWFCPKCQS